MKIGPGVSELWRVENRPLPLTLPVAYTTACTTVQAVINSGFITPTAAEWRESRKTLKHQKEKKIPLLSVFLY